MKTFTIEEFKNYILSKDSIGDIMFYLSEENVKKANKKISFTLQEILSNGNNWCEFCDEYGINEYAVNEGGGDVSIDVLISDAKRWGLI